MKSVIIFWIYSADQYADRTPLNEITEHAQLNGFNDEPVDVLCLHGFQFIPAADIALMRERNFIVQDVSPLFEKIANHYPNLRQRYTNHFFECFIRWLVIKEFYQGTPVLAWDADIFFNGKLSRLHAEFAGSTFTSSSTCFVALHDRGWLEVYEEQLNLFEQNPQSFLFAAFMRLNKLQLAGHDFQTSFFGPKTEASLNSVEIWQQTFDWSPEEMFVDYLVRTERLPYHLAKGSSRYLLCAQPLLLPQLAWTHPLGTGFDTAVPDGSALTKENGCYQVGGRPLAFLHFQGAVFRACAAHQILHGILREPQPLHDEYCLPGRRAGIEVGTLFNGHRSAMIDRLNRQIGLEKLRQQWGDPYSERDVARNYLIKSDILDVLRNYGQFQAHPGSKEDRQSVAAAKLFGSSPKATIPKELSRDHLENFLRRGQEMIAAGDIAAAIEQLVQAVEASPGDSDLLATIGQLHATQSNKDAARHFYSRALVVNPNHSQAKQWLLELTVGRDDKPVSRNGNKGSRTVTLPMGKICLATNYLQMTEATRQMWEDFSTHLKEQGCQLVLLSTLLPEKPFSFPVFQMPYYMRNFAEWFPRLAFTGDTHVSVKEVELLRADMSRVAQEYPLSEAVAGLTAYRAFANELLQALQPAFVFIADNMLCQTAVLQRLCWDANIPVHIYERGLLPETLMIESRGVQSLSDLRTNWLANDIPGTAHDTARYDRIRNYYLAKKPQKYVQPDFAGGGQDLRKQFNLDGKKVVLFLGGGFEANGHAPKGSNQARAFFPTFRSTEEALMGLWKVVEKMPNTALVFKPHPLDHEMYAIAKIEGVKVVTDVNVHALIEAADVVAVQFTTLQFETVFYEKPILLLGRSVWWGRNATYEVESAEQLPAVLNDALAKKNWPAIQANAHAFDVWMMEHFLIGCTPEVPARQNLADLARFVSRAGLDSRGLAPVNVRWDKFQSNISQVRSGAAPVAPKPVASAAVEMMPDDPAKPNPLKGQPLLEPIAWQELLEKAPAEVVVGDLALNT